MEKAKKIMIPILAVITVIGICISLDTTKIFIDTDIVFPILLFFFLFLLYSQNMKIKDKRASICSILLAAILAGILVVGYSIHYDGNLKAIIGNGMAIIKSFLKWISYTLSFSAILFFLYTKVFPSQKEKGQRKLRFFTDNKISFFFLAFLLLLAYVPYFLFEFPGSFSTDSITEMSFALGPMNDLINHHPVFHIGVIWVCLKLGLWMGNSITYGIAIYSILQMIATAFTFSFVLYYLARKKVPNAVRAIVFLIFAFYPPFGFYSIIMWKDIPFALSLVWFVISLWEMASHTENFFKSWKWQLVFFFSAIFVMLFRNNGIYVIGLTLPFLVFWLKERRKRILLLSLSLLLFWGIWKAPIFTAFHIQEGPVREALSVPLQQIARTVKYEGEQLTEKQKEVIGKYLPAENLGERYNPYISDQVKDLFNQQEWEENKKEFITLWGELFLQYPGIYVESFLQGSSGYWYPEEKNWVIPNWFDYEEAPEPFQNIRIPLLESSFITSLLQHCNERDIPIFSAFFSIGFLFWLYLIFAFYLIYQKRYQLLLPYIPLFVLWLTITASPAWCEYRFAYGMFTVAPMLFTITLWESRKNNDQTKGEERNEN